MQVQILQQLTELKELIQSQAIHQKEILSLAETAQFLGVSRSYVYKLTCSRQIPCYCPTGKILYFRRSELMDWVYQNRQATAPEIAEQVFHHLGQKKM